MLSEDGTLTMAALARRIGITTKAVEKQIARLKADGTLGTAPQQEYGIYIVPNVTGYKLTVEDNTIQNVKSHGFTIQGGGEGSAKTTIGE